MNCAECRDQLIAWAEGLLDRETDRQCREHCATCATCHAEHQAVLRLQQCLLLRGQTAAGVNLINPVMRRIRAEMFKPERESIMSKLLKHRWGFGLGAAAVAATVLAAMLFTIPKAQAKVDEVMNEGAQAVAKLTSIHLRGQLRTLPGDNFGYINADCPFSSIELWKQFQPDLKWRVEKPGRIVVMDGQSTVMFMNDKTAVKVPQATRSAFDTEWLQRIANLSQTITNELINAQAKGWQLNLAQETGADGRQKSVVTVLAKSGLPDNDYLKNSFYENADTRRVYRFDSQSELLESVQIYLTRAAGDVEIFDLNQIDYNQAIDTNVWQLALPADVSWVEQPQKLPDNNKYTANAMTAEQAARAFFEACGRKEWVEVAKFMSPVNDQLKQYVGGLEIVSLGTAFTSQAYSGKFVPYEIKLPPQDFLVRVSTNNAASRYVLAGIYDRQMKAQPQSFQWDGAAEILTNNDVYAQLSPQAVVQAYFTAESNLDWVEMAKFTAAADVAETKSQIAMAEKNGLDAHKVLPEFVVGEAFWSREQSAWFVKCQAMSVKKWNLALRNDNPTGRWQVDGGF